MNSFRRYFNFIWPMVLWVFIFRDFIWGSISINHDTVLSYGVAKFFVNNLLNGTFPLWDPFLFVGTPFYSLAFLGLFSPLIYFMALLVLLGVDYYSAYVIYLVLNFFVGCAGFYLLARVLLQSHFFALIFYVLLLFSGLSHSVFAQHNMLFMFVPAGWFFYFLFKFSREGSQGAFLGLIFSSMMLVGHYLPFHFLTLFLLFVVMMFVCCKAACFRFLKGLIYFFRKNIVVGIVGVLGLGVSCLPIVFYVLSNGPQDIVTPGRYCNYKEAHNCYESTLNTQLKLSYTDASQSGILSERVGPLDFLFHFDKMSYGTDGVFYVSIYCWIVLVAAFFLPMTKLLVIMGLMSVVLLLISLGPLTPLYPWLHKNIFYFKLFHNLFFFIVYLTPLVILLSICQLKMLMQCLEHRISIPSRTLKGILILLALVQPLYVFEHFKQNAKAFECRFPSSHVEKTFAFERPQENRYPDCLSMHYLPSIKDFWHDMTLSDSTGYVGSPGTVGRGVFYLNRRMEEKVWLDSVRYKFWIYDRITAFKEDEKHLRSLIASMTNKENLAYVENPDLLVLATLLRKDTSKEKLGVVTNNVPQFIVHDFNSNEIRFKTNFPQDNFLVYTQSFHSRWKLWLNGKPARVYRTNAAFIGIFLPKGENAVELRFVPLGGERGYVVIVFFILVFFGWTIAVNIKESKQGCSYRYD